MKILILDGSTAADAAGKRIASAFITELASYDWEIEHLILREMKIGNCAGDFFCWIRTPGTCMVDDDNRAVAQAVIRSDWVIFLTSVTFGGYSSTLKRAVDRLTQNNLPYFMTTGEEIHHEPRYARYPGLLAIGWMEERQANEEIIFQSLVQRNVVNMHFSSTVSGIIYASQPDEELVSKLRGWVKEIQNGISTPSGTLTGSPADGARNSAVRRALLLVGSPRGKKSTSHSLGAYLFERLAKNGIKTKTIHLVPALTSEAGTQALLEAADENDLIVLASPLYIDSLPAAVTQALELIAAHCTLKPEQHIFTALINSGFPEAKQSDTALAICAAFAHQTGFSWAGGLALGGGAGVVDGVPLTDLGWRARSIRKALELTASSLAEGNPIPEKAKRLMGKTRIPKWLLFAASELGWKQRSKKFGAEKALRQRPYLTD